jgi:hypothetical protein
MASRPAAGPDFQSRTRSLSFRRVAVSEQAPPHELEVLFKFLIVRPLMCSSSALQTRVHAVHAVTPF